MILAINENIGFSSRTLTGVTVSQIKSLPGEVDNVCGEDGKPLLEMDAIVLKLHDCMKGRLNPHISRCIHVPRAKPI